MYDVRLSQLQRRYGQYFTNVLSDPQLFGLSDTFLQLNKVMLHGLAWPRSATDKEGDTKAGQPYMALYQRDKQIYGAYGEYLGGSLYQFDIRQTAVGDVALALWLGPYRYSFSPPLLVYQFHASFMLPGVQRIYSDQLDFPALTRGQAAYTSAPTLEPFMSIMQAGGRRPPAKDIFDTLFVDLFVDDSDITLKTAEPQPDTRQ